MASAISHAAVALAIGACFPRKQVPRAALALGAALAISPDLDAIGYWLGVPGGSPLGHRGLTHSLAFALALGLLAAWWFARHGKPKAAGIWLAVYFVLVIASHGALDALTNGGRGVAFFSPFSPTRYFFRFRPINVSPIGFNVLNQRGIGILSTELRWILLPAAALAALGILVRWLAAYFGSVRPQREVPP